VHEQELKGSLKGVEHTSHSYYRHKLKNIGYYYPSVYVCHDQLYKMCASNFIQQEHAPIYSQPILNLASLPSKLTQWYSWPYIHILNSMVPTIGIRAHDAFALDSVLLSVGLHLNITNSTKKLSQRYQVQRTPSALIPNCQKHEFRTGTYCCKHDWDNSNEKEGIYNIWSIGMKENRNGLSFSVLNETRSAYRANDC
jgi:hypothetical protein